MTEIIITQPKLELLAEAVHNAFVAANKGKHNYFTYSELGEEAKQTDRETAIAVIGAINSSCDNAVIEVHEDDR